VANTTFYERGNVYHDSAGNPAIIKNGNELTFTDNFNAGGGGTSYIPPAYSTDEVNTGRKWIDGKDIYEKTYHYKNGIALTNAGADSGIPYTNFDKIINCRAVGNNCQFVSCNTFYSSTNIRVSVHEPLTVYDIIFEYTKPTPAETNTNTRTVKKAVKRG
jgi:hypothetical protein